MHGTSPTHRALLRAARGSSIDDPREILGGVADRSHASDDGLHGLHLRRPHVSARRGPGTGGECHVLRSSFVCARARLGEPEELGAAELPLLDPLVRVLGLRLQLRPIACPLRPSTDARAGVARRRASGAGAGAGAGASAGAGTPLSGAGRPFAPRRRATPFRGAGSGRGRPRAP